MYFNQSNATEMFLNKIYIYSFVKGCFSCFARKSSFSNVSSKTSFKMQPFSVFIPNESQLLINVNPLYSRIKGQLEELASNEIKLFQMRRSSSVSMILLFNVYLFSGADF